MEPTERKSGVNRRGLFAGIATGLGLAAVALSGRKADAEPKQAPAKGPVLYRRGVEAERYFKTMF